LSGVLYPEFHGHHDDQFGADHNPNHAHGYHPNPDDDHSNCNDADEPGYYYECGERRGWPWTG
jgi:hypothetical protein